MKEKTLDLFDLAVFEFESLYFVFASILACFPPLVVFVLSVVLNCKHLNYNLFWCVLWGNLDQDQWPMIIRILVHQKKWWIRNQTEFIGSFDAPWSEWSWFTDPDPNHPKGRHPLLLCGTFVVCDSYKEIHVAWLDNPADSCMREVWSSGDWFSLLII